MRTFIYIISVLWFLSTRSTQIKSKLYKPQLHLKSSGVLLFRMSPNLDGGRHFPQCAAVRRVRVFPSVSSASAGRHRGSPSVRDSGSCLCGVTRDSATPHMIFSSQSFPCAVLFGTEDDISSTVENKCSSEAAVLLVQERPRGPRWWARCFKERVTRRANATPGSHVPENLCSTCFWRRQESTHRQESVLICGRSPRSEITRTTSHPAIQPCFNILLGSRLPVLFLPLPAIIKRPTYIL